MALTPRLRFANTPGARLVLRALREHKFLHDDDHESISEDQKHAHTWASHLASALEFYAVDREIELRRTLIHTSTSGTSSAGRRARAPRNRPARARRGVMR